MDRLRKTWLRTLFLVAMTAAWSVKALEAGLPDPCEELAGVQGIVLIGAEGSSEGRSLPQDEHSRHACHCSHTHLSGVLTSEAAESVTPPKGHPTIHSPQSYRSRTLTPPVPPPLS